MSGSKSFKSTIDRERKVLELRASGQTFEQIATACAYSDRSVAYNAYKRALKRTLVEPARQVRDLEVHRLDLLLGAAWNQALAGDLRAIQSALKIMERRAKLLGLDQPIHVKSDVYDYTTELEIDKELSRLIDLINSNSQSI